MAARRVSNIYVTYIIAGFTGERKYISGVTVMRVSRTHIPRDACFPTHRSLMHLCSTSHSDNNSYVPPGILFPPGPVA